MADYSRYKTATLLKMLESANEKYMKEAAKPAGNWGNGMRLSKLPDFKGWIKAKERYDSILSELSRRKRAGNCEE